MIKTVLTLTDQEKIKSDLSFLKKLLIFAKKQNYRVVVTGGYGLDGILGQITRPHNDIDIVIYSKDDREMTVKSIRNFVEKVFINPRITIRFNQFMHTIDINTKGFGGNIYVVQTKNNPFDDLKTLVLNDKTIHRNNPLQFPLPISAILHGLQFETQDPHAHLADILFKQKREMKYNKHEQDIKNLEQVTDSNRVRQILLLS